MEEGRQQLLPLKPSNKSLFIISKVPLGPKRLNLKTLHFILSQIRKEGKRSPLTYQDPALLSDGVKTRPPTSQLSGFLSCHTVGLTGI